MTLITKQVVPTTCCALVFSLSTEILGRVTGQNSGQGVVGLGRGDVSSQVSIITLHTFFRSALKPKKLGNGQVTQLPSSHN